VRLYFETQVGHTEGNLYWMNTRITTAGAQDAWTSPDVKLVATDWDDARRQARRSVDALARHLGLKPEVDGGVLSYVPKEN
jgi:hypothetical protein